MLLLLLIKTDKLLAKWAGVWLSGQGPQQQTDNDLSVPTTTLRTMTTKGKTV